MVMINKDSVVLLRESISASKDYIEICLREDIPIRCINRETGKTKTIPFKFLHNNNNRFWLQNETWEYFLAKDDFQKIQDKASEPKPDWKPLTAIPDDELKTENAAHDQGFGKEYTAFAKMTEAERVRRMKECENRLNSLIVQKPRQEDRVTEALVETARDAMLHNHAVLMNVMDIPDDEAKKQTQEMVDSTYDFVKLSSQLISTNIFNDDLMNTLVAKSNGTIIQHMNRVYLNGLAFLSYYNKIVSASSIINKLRVSFDKRYKLFYHSLLPHIHPDDITLEKVFLGGMRAISEEIFYNWAVGFLIHDIGKAAAVEYHEGEAAYNRDIVMEHVKIGYNSVMNKTNYPREAALITGYHHEYYGDPGGYGYFRSYLDQYKKANPFARQSCCMAYELEPMLDYKTLAYFPAKILEIIDVFDSVTDPNRKYRKAMTTEEALAMMEEEFITKHPKIDIILFDIFSRFVREKPSA